LSRLLLFYALEEGKEPLDASAVHPESYALAKEIVVRCNTTTQQLIANDAELDTINATDFVNTQHGLPTVIDVINELKRPARDPRGDFKAAKLMEGIETINDLELEMELEGTVTNVANFGAFVDIGVHQDGLVHISQLADGFVSDPRKVVKVGQVVKVRVTDIDVARKRIALSMKQQSTSGTKHHHTENKKKLTAQGTMAAAFNTARKN